LPGPLADLDADQQAGVWQRYALEWPPMEDASPRFSTLMRATTGVNQSLSRLWELAVFGYLLVPATRYHGARMLPVLALVASAAAFLAAVRLVPGLDFAAGRSPIGVALVTGLVALIAVSIPTLTARLRPNPGPVAIAILSVVVQAVVLLAVAALGSPLGLGLELGRWPREAGPDSVAVALATAALLSIVPVALALTGRNQQALPIRARPALEWSPATPVLLMFFLSGAAGLIYEVVWARQLVLVFGNTTQAVSAILTGYFGGLAIGAVIGGRIADRVRSPLRLYGIVEIALVVIVLITPILFRGLHELYRGGYSTLQGSPTTVALLRYVLALLALAPATVLMGATLPTLSRHLTRRRDELSANFGRLYAMNTTGAVVGTLLAGLALIELFGLTATLAVGAIGSGIAGIAAIILSGRATGTPEEAVPPAAEPQALPPSPTRNLGLVVAFVSGLTSLGYQVLWTRLLSSGSGNTTYVFTLILAIFLVGIALGAAFFVRRLSGNPRLIGLLGIAQLVIAAIALLGLPFLARIVEVPFLLRVALVVLPTTLVLGLTLPMASSLVGADEHRAGRDAGLLLGANTLGAICGTFLIPFLFIPAIGSPRSVATLATVNAVLGAILLLREHRLPTPRRATSAAALVVAIVAAAATAIPNPVVADPGLVTFARGGSTVYASAEDEISTVQAGASPDGRKRLTVGGTGMTSLTVDARFMTLLPLMVNPDARDALVIAFGMGSSWRSALVAGLTADGVELVPSVPRMFPYYHPDSTELLSDPRGRIIVADGRNYVELTDRTYDIVIVDPPPPIQSSGTAILYSEEFYRANAARLRDGGVMMEWMPFGGEAYGQSVDEFRAHVRTFTTVFPEVMLSFAPENHGVYMLGSTRPIVLEPETIREVLSRPGVLEDLATSDDAPPRTLDEWAAIVPELPWLDTEGARQFGGSGPTITDDRPLPEYFLLRDLFGPASPRMRPGSLRAATEGL
jgi:spermidine synthase